MVGIKFEVENVIFFYCLKYVEIWEQFLTILLIFAVTIAKMLQKKWNDYSPVLQGDSLSFNFEK